MATNRPPDFRRLPLASHRRHAMALFTSLTLLLAAVVYAQKAPPATEVQRTASQAVDAGPDTQIEDEHRSTQVALTAAEVQHVQKLYGPCVHCHGVEGEGRRALGTPRIGDLSAAYLESQLMAFRSGKRGFHVDDVQSRPMVSLARGFASDDVTRVLAAYVSQRRPPHVMAGVPDARGATLYVACAGCHGEDARGNDALQSPGLLFQDSAYVVRQLQNYRDQKRGAPGPGADPLAVAMAAQVATLSDDDMNALARHIASLRPERPPLANYEVTATKKDGLQAFADIFAVATHPRCKNCHPDGDRPLQSDASLPHAFNITRWTPFKGVHCASCHAAAPVGAQRAPAPPADPLWSLAPRHMVFENRTPSQLCEQLKDPALNGGRGLIDLTAHVANDHLLQTSWHSGRTPPPVSHPVLVKQFETWGRAGAPCPVP